MAARGGEGVSGALRSYLAPIRVLWGRGQYSSGLGLSGNCTHPAILLRSPATGTDRGNRRACGVPRFMPKAESRRVPTN